ncbi:MAG: 30S ribosomal protein S24e [Candidatus Methanogranum gryphiswaldense]|jgi:small subunit ribosomal protein S24e|nr:MAG: 30S ribosomal protein S24e [Candidatus Methanogranum sp. U3.2.1]
MKMEIKEQKKNPLMKRAEVYFTLEHVGQSTPGRNVIAEELSKKLKTKRNCVVIDSVESVYGIGKSEGYAKVYDSKEAALEFESEYLLKRNGIEKEAAPAAPAKE